MAVINHWHGLIVGIQYSMAESLFISIDVLCLVASERRNDDSNSQAISCIGHLYSSEDYQLLAVT